MFSCCRHPLAEPNTVLVVLTTTWLRIKAVNLLYVGVAKLSLGSGHVESSINMEHKTPIHFVDKN